MLWELMFLKAIEKFQWFLCTLWKIEWFQGTTGTTTNEATVHKVYLNFSLFFDRLISDFPSSPKTVLDKPQSSDFHKRQRSKKYLLWENPIWCGVFRFAQSIIYIFLIDHDFIKIQSSLGIPRRNHPLFLPVGSAKQGGNLCSLFALSR